MNEMHEDNNANQIDDLHDRLLDRSLSELLGGERAPDLSERILAAAGCLGQRPSEVGAESTASGAMPQPPLTPANAEAPAPGWRQLALAASLLVALGLSITAILWPGSGKPPGSIVVLIDRNDSKSMPDQIDAQTTAMHNVRNSGTEPASGTRNQNPQSNGSRPKVAAVDSEDSYLRRAQEFARKRAHLYELSQHMGTPSSQRAEAKQQLLIDYLIQLRKEITQQHALVFEKKTSLATFQKQNGLAGSQAGPQDPVPDALIAQAIEEDPDYRLNEARVKKLEIALADLLTVVKGPGPDSPVLRAKREELSKINASLEQRKQAIRKQIATDWKEGRIVPRAKAELEAQTNELASAEATLTEMESQFKSLSKDVEDLANSTADIDIDRLREEVQAEAQALSAYAAAHPQAEQPPTASLAIGGKSSVTKSSEGMTRYESLVKESNAVPAPSPVPPGPWKAGGQIPSGVPQSLALGGVSRGFGQRLRTEALSGSPAVNSFTVVKPTYENKNPQQSALRELKRFDDDRGSYTANKESLARQIEDKRKQINGLEAKAREQTSSLATAITAHSTGRIRLPQAINDGYAASQDGEDLLSFAQPQKPGAPANGVSDRALKSIDPALTINTPADFKTAPMFDGLVTGVRVKGDDTYAHFSIGSDAGVQVGHEVEVFHDGKSVGKMVVIRVTPEGSVAKMEPGHKGEIVRGDRIETLTNGKLTDEQPAPAEPEQGQGPGAGGDRYRHIQENPFLASLQEPLSTFSIDVDTASYSNIRQFMMEQGVLPPPDAVRIEELVNYFHYDYAPPQDKRPFAAHIEAARCPWQPEHYLVRVALKGREVKNDKRPRANLVFLVDVSGSMNEPDRLPLVIRGLKLLTEQLRNDDHVAIVVYAGNEGLVLPSTPGENRAAILAALGNLQAGGSTNGGAGIKLAYKVAQENFVPGGINRVILATDGDFNVGLTSEGDLERLAEEKAKSNVFLTVLGVGRGNFNDSLLEAVTNKAKGNYAYVDNFSECRKVFEEQLTGTLMTIAKDVKIQIEFNPAKVAGYRLIGYEDRMLAAEDFNNDKKGAGEIGAGHTVTALYEIVPAGKVVDTTDVDALKYQKPQHLTDAAKKGELLTLKLRYKEPEGDKSSLIEVPLADQVKKFAAASSDFQFAASVAAFGMLLRDSKFKGSATYDAVLEIATQNKGADKEGHRNEFLEIVRRTKKIGK